ncbi:Spermidine synthase [hydrothermal vent metagenome]|uniref:Spermidine synthase n=1 Tax=hydrothermal vent metagenome TaxID=652676 RepID=A0A3B1DD68_9ZZZZ
MNLSFIIYPITFILALCSIVYELILAQSLAAFLENTVLRYSITIGLYMCSMGFGALAAERFTKNPIITLLRIEILLVLTGGFSLIFLHMVDYFSSERIVLSLCAHMLILGVGFLTGFEIPLLMAIKGKDAEHSLLGINYFGAFCGTIIFAFIFYPRLGLMASAFLTGAMNGAAGILLATQHKQVEDQEKSQYYNLLSVQTILFVGIVICFMYAKPIGQFFIDQYMR